MAPAGPVSSAKRRNRANELRHVQRVGQRYADDRQSHHDYVASVTTPQVSRQPTPEELERYTTQSPTASRPATFNAAPKGAVTGSAAKPRTRKAGDHLFVCDQCYRAWRLGATPDTKHRECLRRLAQRPGGRHLSTVR